MLNEALKQIRLFHEIKPTDLAYRLGISELHLSEIESNEKPVCTDILRKYAEYFSLPESSLIMFSENMDSTRKSDNLRIKYARKIINLMQWIRTRHEDETKM